MAVDVRTIHTPWGGVRLPDGIGLTVHRVADSSDEYGVALSEMARKLFEQARGIFTFGHL